MKAVFQKILSFLMSLLVLFSTISFTVDKHYCGDSLVDSTIFFEAESCGMESETTKDSSECSFNKIDCCSDVTFMFQGQNDLKIPIESVDLQTQQLITAFYITYVNLFEGLKENVVPFDGYPPPLLVTDIQLTNETFII